VSRPTRRAATPAKRRAAGDGELSRRRFVALVAAGSAALAATPALAAPTPRRKPAPPPPAKPAPHPEPAETARFEKQRENLRATLKTIREVPLPPGGDLSVVFRPLRPVRKGR